jgi:DNA-binding transcriptional LysR family regulator
MNDITLQQIEVFLTVSEQLNLSEASKDLFLCQSGVSKWISRLEKSLNIKLFDRTNRGVELTDNGQFLYAELKPLYDKLNSTMQNIRDFYDMSGNIINIGCLDTPEVIKALKDEIKLNSGNGYETDKILRIHLYSFKDLREELICGNLDCIVAYEIGFGKYINISRKRIKRLDTFIAVSKQNEISESDDFPSAEKLSNEALYLLSIAEMEEPERRAIRICEGIGFKPKEIQYLPTHFSLELAIKNNKGFCVAGSDICEHFEDDIKLFKVENPPNEQYVIIAWRDKNASDITMEFIDSLETAE